MVTIQNSPFIAAAEASTEPAGALEAGILQAFFSQLTGRELTCVQTDCESLGADRNRFILGLESRLKSVPSLVQEGQSHDTILQMLTR